MRVLAAAMRPRWALALALALALTARCAGEGATPGECAERCHTFGTCHAPLGRCDCPKGFAGADCSRRAAPSCVLDAHAHIDSGCMSVSSCACLLECEAAGYLSSEVSLCFNASAGAPDAAAVLASPLVVYGSREVVEDGMINSAASPRPDAWRAANGNEALFSALAECSGGCSGHGLCKRPHGGAGVPPRCECFEGYGGPLGACEQFTEESLCPGQCTGRGRCVNGWCHCAHGAYGADCSLTGTLQPSLFWEPTAPAGHNLTAEGAPLRPRIYVYDLPPRFNTWWRIPAPERNLGVQLHERLLASRYRTANPEDADFFYVPTSPMGQQNHYNAVRAARFVAAQYPFWDRHNGSDHIYAWPWDFGACWVGGHPYLKNSIFLGHFGLDTKLAAYACDCPLCAPAYTRGKDIVLPDTFELAVKRSAPALRHAAAAADANSPAPPRPTRLFFSGGRTGPSREALFAAQLSGPGVKVVEGHIDLAAEMASAVFCISAPGAGFGTRAALAIVFGCIPVSFVDAVHEPFEDVVDYGAIGVRIPEAQLPNMVKLLDAITPDEVAAKQAALACVAEHFVWSSVHGALGDEDGGGDAFEVMMYALRRRLSPGPHPLLSCATPRVPGAPAPLRPVCRYQGCRASRAWPPGGAACGDSYERPC